MKGASILVVAILTLGLVAYPAAANVVITCTDLGSGIAEVGYDASEESVLVRAFALDITVGGGATIESIGDYKVGLSTAGDPGYGIFPDSIQINEATGEVIDWGTPVCRDAYGGWATQPGLGTSGITIGMGSLYEGADNAPLASDMLCKIGIAWRGASMVNMTISENMRRGGVIMEDIDINPTVDVIGCTLVIPEPTTLFLLGLGAVMLRRRKCC